jgi:hypothetical protein
MTQFVRTNNARLMLPTSDLARPHCVGRGSATSLKARPKVSRMRAQRRDPTDEDS